jgi:hypothetical protein
MSSCSAFRENSMAVVSVWRAVVGSAVRRSWSSFGAALALLAVVSACDAKVRPMSITQSDGGTLAEPAGPAPAASGNEETVVEDLLGNDMTGGLAGVMCDADTGTCPDAAAPILCAGCLIDAVCVAAGVVDPSNPCQACDPARNEAAWSSLDGTTCDDGLFCTTADVCASSVCSGTPFECEDGVDCNGISSCDEEADACTPDSNACPDGSSCDVASNSCVTECAGCLVADVCLPIGQTAAGNPCLVCDPAQSTIALSPAPAGTPCDDGAFCSVSDQCQGGQCIGGGARSCGQNQVCNETQNQCQCPGCVIGGSCVANGVSSPDDACLVCDPNRSRTAFSESLAASCQRASGAECTSDSQCSSNRCLLQYGDGDRDGFAPLSAIASAIRLCTGTGAVAGFTTVRPVSTATTDCLDTNASVFPGQTRFFVTPALGLQPAFDYDCDGVEVDGFGNRISNCNDRAVPVCEDRGGWGDVLPPCGSQETGIGSVQPCQTNPETGQCVPAPGGPAASRDCK